MSRQYILWKSKTLNLCSCFQQSWFSASFRPHLEVIRLLACVSLALLTTLEKDQQSVGHFTRAPHLLLQALENDQLYLVFHFDWGYGSQNVDLIKEVFVQKLWAQMCPVRGPVGSAALCWYSCHFTGVFSAQDGSCTFIKPAERPAAIISPTPPASPGLPEHTHTHTHGQTLDGDTHFSY